MSLKELIEQSEEYWREGDKKYTFIPKGEAIVEGSHGIIVKLGDDYFVACYYEFKDGEIDYSKGLTRKLTLEGVKEHLKTHQLLDTGSVIELGELFKRSEEITDNELIIKVKQKIEDINELVDKTYNDDEDEEDDDL